MRREWEDLAPTRTGGEVGASSEPCEASAGANSRGTDIDVSAPPRLCGILSWRALR